MNPKSPIQRAIPSDELDAKIKSLFDLATELAHEMRDESASAREIDTPDITDRLEAQLRESLEDEIVPVSLMQGAGIDRTEIEREVVKKALVSLKLRTLKTIARREGAASSGNLEDVATRIAQKYKWDEAAVARLILANEDEPSAERGHLTRLYPLVGAVDVTKAQQSLTSVMDRYIRTGIARWFLFNDLQIRNGALEVLGTYKTYQASVEAIEDQAALSSTSNDAEVKLAIDASAILQVQGAAAVPAKAAVRAFETITGCEAKWYLPLADKNAKGSGKALHPTSEFLLDLVYNRIMRSSLQDINLTVARFNVRRNLDAGQGATVGERRPELKAVRFEGEHLLDSVTACRLLTVEHRPLVEVAFTAIASNEDGSSKGRFPVRITTESDHVVAETGLGSEAHELSLRVHEVVTSAISESFQLGGRGDEAERLARLVERMKVRASSSSSPDVADIFE